MKRTFLTSLILAVAMIFAGPAFADKHAQQEGHGSHHAKAMKKSEAPPMTAEQKAMMEAFEKQATPGADHQVLDGLAGKWKYEAKSWMKPDAQAEVTTGTSQNEWVMGKRFLQQHAKGMWMGKPFEGKGLTGYNNMSKMYQSVWYDSMNTGMVLSTGTYNASEKSITETGTASCPITGEKDRAFRNVIKMPDQNHYTYEMYMKDPGTKKEFKMMEIAYERVGNTKVSKR